VAGIVDKNWAKGQKLPWQQQAPGTGTSSPTPPRPAYDQTAADRQNAKWGKQDRDRTLAKQKSAYSRNLLGAQLNMQGQQALDKAQMDANAAAKTGALATPTPSPSMAGLQAAVTGMGGGDASNVSGGSGLYTPGEGGEGGGPGVNLSGPFALRQGLGTRILPQLSPSLAGLRSLY